MIRNAGVHIPAHSSWGSLKSSSTTKMDKKNNLHNKERARCNGHKCKEKVFQERNFAPKGEECEKCYVTSFEEFRVRPSSQTPYFDNDFLTRFTLV